MRFFLASWLVGLVALAIAAAVLLSPRTLAHTATPAMPGPDRLVVAVMAN
ncbi:MAG: hypothetical protein JSR91_12865 [Proteobacteria bacterium]|nr:hypothetical protein [Pseudomonadota bacterium]